jgi:cytokinesis protein
MDDLLAKLRAAKPEARDQRDRRRRARLKEKHAVRVASGQKMPDMVELVNPDGAEQDTGLLSPTSEGSETFSKAAAEEDAAVDIANQAANLLQGLGGKSDDEKDVSATPQASSSLRVRRRRENAEDERARRRQRRQQARSEISVGSTAGMTEEGDEEKEDNKAEEGDDDLDETASQASPRKLPRPPPVTIVSPPSPEGGDKERRALPEISLPPRVE